MIWLSKLTVGLLDGVGVGLTDGEVDGLDEGFVCETSYKKKILRSCYVMKKVRI